MELGDRQKVLMSQDYTPNMKQYEYHEGPEALKRFKEGMTALFKIPKEAVKPRPKPKCKQSTPSKG